MQRGDLKKTIQFIKEQLRNHDNYYLKNETAVRTQIVDPILYSLGWDTRDPDQVRHEDATDEGRADYCLIKNRKKVLFVEAKNLSKSVESPDHIHQLAKYTFQEGVDYGVITNGRNWLLLRSYERNKRLEDRKIWSVDLFSDKFETVLSRLGCISKENVSNIPSVVRRQKILLKNWEELMSSPERLVGPISRLMKTQGGKVSAEEIKAFVSMKLRELMPESADYGQMPKARARKPGRPTMTGMPAYRKPADSVRKPGRPTLKRRKSPGRVQGSKKSVILTIRDQSTTITRSWEILFHTANYLFNHGFFNKSDLPIATSKKRFLVNKVPKHPNGRRFFQEKQLDNGYYLETHYSEENGIKMARNLLKMAGLSERDLKIKY